MTRRTATTLARVVVFVAAVLLAVAVAGAAWGQSAQSAGACFRIPPVGTAQTSGVLAARHYADTGKGPQVTYLDIDYGRGQTVRAYCHLGWKVDCEVGEVGEVVSVRLDINSVGGKLTAYVGSVDGSSFGDSVPCP